MTDLISFLNARLAEDEAAAQATLIDVTGSGDWRADERPVALTVDLYRVRDVNARPVVEAVKSLYGDEGPAEPLYVDGEAIAAHVALHDPARVLREVTAKRALIEDHDDQHECVHWKDASAFPYVGCSVLRRLAAIYSDHSDYNPEWSTT
jgi:hypothetical protein